ncbi:polysaccharide deacetylase family protein [Patescibacteria group bacterium]|nr:polysaccharide deacetylase family protein [Patescibacteria group bacterium]
MIIKIPNNFLAERKYIISTLFNEFLGLKYQIETYNQNDYKIILGNKKELIIKDSFFSNFKNQNYLSTQNIAQLPLQKSNNKFASKKNLPIIYGDNALEISDNKIICKIDIFASCFFMLTRWEEYVIKKRDKYNRFIPTESLAYKQKFLHRPITNEYTEMLWNMLKFLKIKQTRKKRKFTICLTHDVDEIDRYKWYPPLIAIKKTIKKLAFKKLIKILFDYIKVKIKLKNDPYHDIFLNYIINLEKKYKFKSSFYFMTDNKRYLLSNPILKKIIAKLKKEKFEIGIQTGFRAYNNPKIIKKEKIEFEKIINKKITSGRQHYLKWAGPKSWETWENADLKYDTTLCYANFNGFRCGVCYPFKPFNILKKKVINIWEIPLIVMDGTLDNKKLSYSEAFKEIIKLLNQTKNYNGIFVFLWHNCYMTELFTPKWKRLFENFYKLISKEKYLVIPINKINKDAKSISN